MNGMGEPIMRNAVLALVTLAVTTASVPAQGWAEKMFKEGLTHDFGTVPRGAQLVHKFRMTNIYAVEMKITGIKSGCGCVTATAEKEALAPRESTWLEVRMDGRRFAGAKEVGVRVTVGPNFISSAEVKVKANSRSDIVFNPGEVSFGTVVQGQTPTQVIDVEYAGRLAFVVQGVSAQGVPYDVNIKEIYRRPGQVGYRMTVTLKADAPAGAAKHEVTLKTNDPNSPQVPVLIESNILSPVTVTPSPLALGPVKVDTPLIRRVVVRGQQPFRILGVDGVGQGVELEGALGTNMAPIQFVTLKCQFNEAGPIKRELKIRTTAQQAPMTFTVEGAATK